MQINDLGFEAVKDPATGQLLFNVVVGGYFSGQRNIMSMPLGVAVTEEQLVPFAVALLRVFRWDSDKLRTHSPWAWARDVPSYLRSALTKLILAVLNVAVWI